MRVSYPLANPELRLDKTKELLAQQGYSVRESSLRKIVLEQLSYCRSKQDLITLGQQLQQSKFIGYLIEEQMRYAFQTSNRSGVQPVLVQAMPAIFLGLFAMSVVIYDGYVKQQGTENLSARIIEQFKELFGGPYEYADLNDQEKRLLEGRDTKPVDKPQVPSTLINPPAKPLPTKEKVPIIERDWRDSMYAGPSPDDPPIDPKTFLIMYDKVKELEVGTYKDITKRGEKGDGLDADHMPSAAAVVKAYEKATGEKVTKEKRREIINSTNVLVITKELHKQIPTYGGKNKQRSNETSVMSFSQQFNGRYF